MFILVSLAANISLWLFFLLKIKPSEEPIPLRYNIYSGFDLMGSWYYLFLVPLTGLIILAINTILGGGIFVKEQSLGRIIMGGSLICQGLLWVAGYHLLSFL